MSINQILITAGETLHSDIHRLINAIWNKEELMKESAVVHVCKNHIKAKVVNIKAIINQTLNFIQYSSCTVNFQNLIQYSSLNGQFHK